MAKRIGDEQGEQIIGRSGRVHRLVKESLKRSGVPVLMGVLEDLRRIERLRDDADYDLVGDCTAEEALARSEKLVAKIQGLATHYFANLKLA